MGVKDNFIYEECMKELDAMFKLKLTAEQPRQMKKDKQISFGEYFDTQRIRIEKAMQNKNTELHNAWREDYDKRQKALSLLRKMKPVSTREQNIVKEMILKEMK